MKAVNLVPPKSGRGGFGAGAGGRRTPAIVAGAAVLVAGLGWFAWNARQEASDLASQVATAQAEKTQLESQLQSMLAVDQRAGVQLARRGAVVQLTASRINWERLVRDSVTVVPKGVWLTEITGTSPVAATAAVPAAPGQPVAVTSAPTGLHVEGFAFAQPDVAKLMSRLDAVPGLGEARLASSDRMIRGGRPVVQFILDIPIDQRAQDRPTLDVSAGTAAGTTTASGGSAAGAGGFVP